MRASRLLSILMHLQAHGRVSAQRLAAATSVSVRTIYRDVDHLSAAGVPVWAETGRNGGICLRPGWRTQLTGLTAAEARAVFLAGLPGPAAALGLGAAVAGARPKMLSALPPDLQAEALRAGQRFHLDPVDWFRDASAAPGLPVLADAVWHSRRVVVRYQSWRRISQRVIEPLGLVLKAGAWYLAARRAGQPQPRAYALTGVLALRALNTHFEPPAGFDLAAWWAAHTARFEAGVYTASARLQVTERGYHVLCRFSPTVAAAAAASAKPCLPDGWAEVQVPIESVAHAAHEMLRLGADAVVLSPATLRAAVRASARAIGALYAARSASGAAL